MSSNPNETIYRFLVSEEADGEIQPPEETTPEQPTRIRLDRFLADELEDRFSREQLKRLIKQGMASVNDKPQEKASFALKEGDTVTLMVPDAQPITLEPENIPLEVVYEDDDLLVVNKPSGMLTHPAGSEVHGTLVNALLAHCAGRLSGINGFIRPGIVHRLDRETSGLLMVAKTDRAHRGLSEQLKAKTARREYRAIAQGIFREKTGTVRAPIGRNPKAREKMAVIAGGRDAVTHWQVLEEIHGKYSYLELRLETGRTHQIRVHLAHIGHPILGDPLYGTGLEKILKLKTQGQLLHAFRLSFIHPVSGKQQTFEIPTDPTLETTLALLRGGTLIPGD